MSSDDDRLGYWMRIGRLGGGGDGPVVIPMHIFDSKVRLSLFSLLNDDRYRDMAYFSNLCMIKSYPSLYEGSLHFLSFGT